MEIKKAMIESKIVENITLLQDAVDSFNMLLNCTYKIELGHKGKLYLIDLVFLKRNFLHMSGIDKLTDIAASKEPNVFDTLIKNEGDIKNKLVSSIYFESIKSRLCSIIDLKDNFNNAIDNKHFRFIANSFKNYTTIKYDFLIKSEFNSDIYYYFLRYSGSNLNKNECVIVSTFIENEKDYAKGQSLLTLLSKIEFDNSTGIKRIIYDYRNKT